MDIFFGKMGITDLKYKPAYNPCEYCSAQTAAGMLTLLDTEPSMEIFSYRTLLPIS